MKLDRRKALSQFTEFIAEDQELNNSWYLDDEDWILLLVNKTADFLNHQLKILRIYNDDELNEKVLVTINKEIDAINDLLAFKNKLREEQTNAEQ